MLPIYSPAVVSVVWSFKPSSNDPSKSDDRYASIRRRYNSASATVSKSAIPPKIY